MNTTCFCTIHTMLHTTFRMQCVDNLLMTYEPVLQAVWFKLCFALYVPSNFQTRFIIMCCVHASSVLCMLEVYTLMWEYMWLGVCKHDCMWHVACDTLRIAPYVLHALWACMASYCVLSRTVTSNAKHVVHRTLCLFSLFLRVVFLYIVLHIALWVQHAPDDLLASCCIVACMATYRV